MSASTGWYYSVLLGTAPSHTRVHVRASTFLRSRAGQGIVQFARGRNGVEYAIKFYVKQDAFATENALHRSGRLQGILPPAVAIFDNSSGAFVDSQGIRVHPFVVVEKGENLNEWARRKALDLQTTLQALTCVAERLEMLHAAGVVHRDLKPENVLWLPGRREWTLVDYGCAAMEESTCPLTYSIRYVLTMFAMSCLGPKAGRPSLVPDHPY
jgi:serine/threonine protein kinase